MVLSVLSSPFSVGMKEGSLVSRFKVTAHRTSVHRCGGKTRLQPEHLSAGNKSLWK